MLRIRRTFIRWLVAAPATALLCALAPPAAAGPDAAELEPLIEDVRGSYHKIRAYGPDVMPALVELYRQSAEDRRADIAWVFYHLGWKSEAARQVLMDDVHTGHGGLRLQVQWALGRVSDSPAVVDALLQTLRHDDNPLFRDKAACALAYDQIHLSDAEKVRVFAGLIEALNDENPQIRDISIKALQIHTGQTKGYRPNAPAAEREQRVRQWQEWLDKYHANL